MKLLDYSGLQRFLNKIKTLLDSKSNTGHTHTVSDVSGLATVATSGDYGDLSNTPTIPVVNNAKLTIQRNGTTVKTFTANASSNVTANITVPTKTSDLTNDSGFLTSHNPIDSALSSTSTNAVQNKVVNDALTGKSDTGHSHTVSDISDFPTLSTVATSGSYNDLSNKPTIPTVNNKTLTIQKNGTNVATFTANASSNVTANITVPTKTSDLTNDSHQTITVGTDTTSTASPAHGNTFTCIDSVTKDTNGHVTAVNTKTVTLPADNNTDTKMTQNVSTTNATYPILLCATADATANQGAKTGIFAKSVKVNPSTNVISASGFSGPLTGNVTGNCSGSSGSCTGNAATATQFSANKSVTLTGYINGTASSKAGWSIATALKNCYYKTGGTVTNSYFKVASGTLTGAWNRYETLIRFVELTGNASCTLRVYLQLNGSSLLDAGHVTVLDSVNFGTSPFNVVYKNDTDKTLFEIYFQLGAKNHQVNALVLYETQRTATNSCDILTMYNNSTPVAALPSGYTLLTTEFELYCGDFVPSGNNKNLGSSTYQWANIYGTNLHSWNTEYTKGTVPSANKFHSLSFVDSAGSLSSRILRWVNADGYNGFSFQCWNERVSTDSSCTMALGYTPQNVSYCAFSNLDRVVPETTNSTDLGISTLQWKSVYAQTYFYNGTAWGLDKGNLWTEGNTFTKGVILQNTDITNYKANPSSDTEKWIQFWSNEWKYWGGVGHVYLTTGVSEIRIAMTNWRTNGSQGYWHLDFGTDKNFSQVYFRPSENNGCHLGDNDHKWSNTYTTNLSVSGTGTCTTPAVADNSTKIATTTWVTVNRPILAWASRSAIVASGTEFKRASGISLFCGYFSDGAFNYTNDTPPGVVAAGTYELYGSVSPATSSTASDKIFGMWIRIA